MKRMKRRRRRKSKRKRKTERLPVSVNMVKIRKDPGLRVHLFELKEGENKSENSG